MADKKPHMHDTDLMGRIADITEKLDRLRARGCTAFGASGHRMKLKKPMSEAKLARFEARHGITLPPAYRAFLLHVAKSGAGPYYGLRHPKRWAEFVEWVADDVPDDWLARPSPLVPGPNPLPPWPDDDPMPPEALAMYQGVMTLGTRGCTYMMGLVITGACRGRVVYLDADHHEPPYVVRDADFLAWYARWLDEQLAGYGGSWFGYGPAGDEAALRAIIADSDDAALRREAVANLHKLPALSEAVWPLLAARLDGDGPERAPAVDLFEKAPPRWAPTVAALLDDADPDVRRAALDAYARLDPDAAAPVAWRRLLEADGQAEREAAWHILDRADRLDRPRLLRLVAEPKLGRLRSHALRTLDCGPQDVPMLVEHARADDDALRRQALYALDGLGPTLRDVPEADAVRARVTEQLAVEDDRLMTSVLLRLVVTTACHDAAPLLLERAADKSRADGARIEAVGALAALGDARVAPIARSMLGEHRKPDKTPDAVPVPTIAEQVRRSLAGSPDPTLRALAEAG